VIKITAPIEAHQVVPARRRRQIVFNLAFAAAELDGDRAVRARLRSDIVERIGVLRKPWPLLFIGAAATAGAALSGVIAF
jgi:hypothetical protein